jgi:hypothetical protein
MSKAWYGSVKNFKIQMNLSKSAMRSKPISSRDSLLASSEPEHSHTHVEESTCGAKEGKLTREDRLAIWKAQKQAAGSTRSKKKATDLPLMDLTSSQLNSGSSYSLSTNSSFISNVPAQTDARSDNKRHCASKRLARRDSTMPCNLDVSSKPSVSSMPNQSELKEISSTDIAAEEILRPVILGLAPEGDRYDQSNDILIRRANSCDAKPHRLDEHLERHPERKLMSQHEYGSGATELLPEQMDEPTVEILKLQLYDQNNRLLKCTNLLKQLLVEQEDLCKKLMEHESLKERFSKLENTLAEVSLLYQVSQISASTPGPCDQNADVRSKILEEGVTARDREISKLRGRLTSMEVEFKEERERLVAKLMTSEEGKRVAEAALKENDVMWEQLFNTKMTELQAQCADALLLHSSRVHPAADTIGKSQFSEPENGAAATGLSVADGELVSLDDA